MRYLVDRQEMSAMDRHSIETMGIPSIVLMERAAQAVVQEMRGRLVGRPSILVICGTGNNGADGLAIARMLHQKGYPVMAWICGNVEKATQEWQIQQRICENLGIPLLGGILSAQWIQEKQFQVVVDALLGTGLSRNIDAGTQMLMEVVNQSDVYRVAVDIPSGICASNGAIMGGAIQADLTVTFQYQKLGTVLFPGRNYSGEVMVRDIGITHLSQKTVSPKAFTLEEEDMKNLPSRPAYSNKGTFGRLLVVAGSQDMAGAAYLSALAAYRVGAGLVRIYTPEENRMIMQTLLPEAILTTYRPDTLNLDQISWLCHWADAVVIGPGMGVSDWGKSLLAYFLQMGTMPMVLDADALNILAKYPALMEGLRPGLIFTPHLGEMSRLTGLSTAQLAANLPEVTRSFSRHYGVTLVLKDACTLVSQTGEKLYVNTNGNAGMATAGSGDVLAGILGGLLAEKRMSVFETACYGVFLHGRAGDLARGEKGERSIMARDLTDFLP